MKKSQPIRQGQTQWKIMSRAEVAVAVEWAAREGWNPGLNDADCFFNTDSRGFLMAESNGVPEGVISAVAYDQDFGFVGFFIVRPDCRGRRVGLVLGQAALEYLGDRNIGLDGVENKIRNYERMGFSLVCPNYRYEGITFPYTVEERHVVDIGKLERSRILRYDRECFPADRRGFLQGWFSMPESRSLACVEDEMLKGYATIRRCVTGYKIGPLFADDEEAADCLFRAMLRAVKPNEPVFLDIPGNNPLAKQLVDRYHMKTVFGTARMYNKGEPVLAVGKIYGITSFELG